MKRLFLAMELIDIKQEMLLIKNVEVQAKS